MKIAVITPVGPGHQACHAQCLESIESAWQTDPGRFTELLPLAMWDLDGQIGRSARRNQGIELAQAAGAEWIFFLDADDLMSPRAFIDAAPFLDDYDAVWGQICEMPYGKFDEMRLRPRQLEGTTQFDDILKTDPYLSLQMGHFVRTRCAREIGFDEAMNTGEDFRYYLQLCRRYRFIKIAEALFVNQRGQHSILSPTGTQWRQVVQDEFHRSLSDYPLFADVELQETRSRFRIRNPFDLIQSTQCRGEFFEQGELRSLLKLIGTGKSIVEIGANVGNHVVFYAQHMQARKIYPFEPNPACTEILRENIRLNGIEGVIDDRGIGIGLGARNGHFRAVQEDPDNLGATRLIADDSATIVVTSLDEIASGIAFDFMKIDVEGMEFEVLEGARNSIRANRPVIYIEVWNDSIQRLDDWMTANQYELVGYVKLVNAANFLIAPKH
jgi:FkbM family methyltransferase